MEDLLIDLTLIWAAIIAFSLFMYVFMDGFSLGVAILYPFSPDEPARDVMMNTVAPVWDGNQTWLVLAGAGLLAAFPLVYAVFLPALYIGVFLMLAGLIFRGVAFEFRFKAPPEGRFWWNVAFCGGSVVAAFAQGAVVGTYIQGFETEGFRYVGGPFDWLTPFTVMTGLGLVIAYGLLGACWLIMKTDGYVQAWAFRVAPRLLIGVMVVFVLVSLWTPVAQPEVMDRWITGIAYLWVFPVATVLTAGWLVSAVLRRLEGVPFVAAMLLFVFFYLGLVISKWPYLVPPDHTLWDAASSPDAQLFLLIGVLFVIPVVLAYTAWTYWVFSGKVRPGEGYY